MATIDLSILDAAHADKLLPKQLTPKQELYLHNSILTANQIYWLIAGSDEMEIEQLEQITGFHKNTLRQYVRWMISHKLIYAETYSNNKYKLSTKKRRKRRVTTKTK